MRVWKYVCVCACGLRSLINFKFNLHPIEMPRKPTPTSAAAPSKTRCQTPQLPDPSLTLPQNNISFSNCGSQGVLSLSTTSSSTSKPAQGPVRSNWDYCAEQTDFRVCLWMHFEGLKVKGLRDTTVCCLYFYPIHLCFSYFHIFLVLSYKIFYNFNRLGKLWFKVGR